MKLHVDKIKFILRPLTQADENGGENKHIGEAMIGGWGGIETCG